MADMILEEQSVVAKISEIIASIAPIDVLEKRHIQDSLAWIQSGAPIFRIAKPYIPDKHLVVYFVLFDPAALKVLLVEHKNAGLWLPPGGHVEVDEDPIDTVKRECLEELGVHANFLYPTPIFLTSTLTVGLTAGHTDVSLWYVLKGCHTDNYCFDDAEFYKVQWFNLTDIPYTQTDPHMRRFIDKLLQYESQIVKIHCQEPWFSEIKHGRKTVEGRKLSSKYANLKPDQIVRFYCGDDSFEVKIVKVVLYKSLEEYLLVEGVEKVLPGIVSVEDAVNVYLQYNSREELEKAGGFLAIHFKVINAAEIES